MTMPMMTMMMSKVSIFCLFTFLTIMIMMMMMMSSKVSNFRLFIFLLMMIMMMMMSAEERMHPVEAEPFRM